MASALTAGEIAAYRKKGHWKKYFLAVAEYHVVFTAELAAAPASNDMVAQIEYVNEAYPNPDCLDYSALSDIRVGMTLYVGSTSGAYDLGMARIRKTPVHPYLYIDEISEIDWTLGTCLVDTIYLTVVDDYQLRARPIRMLNDVAYMDYDGAVLTNHTTFDPVPIMGGHRIAVLDETTGLASVTLGPDANTAAWVLGSTINHVDWEVPGSISCIPNLLAIRPVVTYDLPGIYPVYCTFTSTTGKTAWGVRYVIVYDHSTNRPITDFSFQNKNVSNDAGGWSFEATVNSGATTADIRDHSLCILFSENYIDGDLVQRAEPFPAYQSVETAGYIARYSLNRNWEKGNVTFTVEGAQGFLKKMQGFPSGLEFKIGTPAAWTDMPLLTVTRMIWHFLHWRTTATKVMDVILPPDTLYATAFNSMQKFLWDQIVEIAQPALFASPGVDCYGRFFLEVEPQMVPEASRSWPVVMDFAKSDLHGDINWDVETESQIGILMSAGLYINSTKAASTFFSLSPGHVMKQYGGDMSVMTNVPLVASQAGSNALCGLYMGWKNNPNKRIEVSLRSNFKAIDLWPRQFFGLTILPADDPRGVGYSGNVIPREITFEDDRNTGFEYPIINFEAESFPQLAINGDIPINPTTSIEFPSFPNFDPDFGDLTLIPPVVLPLPGEPLGDITHCLVHSTNHGFFYTSDFNAPSPSWALANGGIDDEDAEDFENMLVTTSGEVFISWYTQGVWYADSPQGKYTQIISKQDLWDAAGAAWWAQWALNPWTVSDIRIKSIAYNKNSGGLAGIFSVDTRRQLFFTFNSSGVVAVVPFQQEVFDDYNAYGLPGKLSYGGGYWVLSHSTGGGGNGLYISRYTSAATWVDLKDTGFGTPVGAGGLATHYRLGTTGNIMIRNDFGGDYLRIDSNNGQTAGTQMTLPQYFPILTCDDTGQYIMGSYADLWRSSDGGLTWGYACTSCIEGEHLNLPTDFPAVISGIFCIDKDRWILIGKTNNNGITGNVIIYTTDFGDHWVSKVGNLATLYPDSTYENLALDLIQAWQ